MSVSVGFSSSVALYAVRLRLQITAHKYYWSKKEEESKLTLLSMQLTAEMGVNDLQIMQFSLQAVAVATVNATYRWVSL